ncbi:MAG TPA: acyltransferase, partial [Acidocella sp.]|nr:acyltransferase [Acidocella sp.]
TAHGLTPRDAQRFSLSAFVQNLTLVQGWGFSTQGAWDYPSWSVSTEWAGYLLFPLLWYVVSYCEALVSAQIVIAAMTLLGLIAVRYHGSLNLNFADGLFRFFPEFTIGIATARLVPPFADAAPRRTLAIIGAGLVLFCGPVNFDLISVVGLWLLLFVFTMQAEAEAPAMLGSRVFLHRLGLLSYSFYMSFALAELLVSQFFRHQGWAPASHAMLFAGAMLAITSVLAVLLNRLIERPCRRAADHWLAASTPASLSLATKPH